MWNEFKKFAVRGNVIDMAVGVIIGTAFGKIVTSLVSDIIMPPIGLALGKVNFPSLYINLTSTPYASIAEAKAAGAPTINYGIFISTIVDFTIVAFAIFMAVRTINRLKKQAPAVDPTTKSCQYCLLEIPIAAKKCGHCTSNL